MIKPSRLPRSLGFVGYAAALFCLVSGGPFGFEPVVAELGFRTTFLLLALIPIFWAIPIALVTAELGTAMPVEGGYVVWTRRALGPGASFLCGWWTWLYSIVDGAIYPAIFATTGVEILRRLRVEGAEGYHWPLALTIVILTTGLNLGGIKGVGRASVGLAVTILVPFVPLVLLGAKASHPAVPSAAIGGVSVATGLAAMMWNFLGWDNLSTVDGELKNPARTIPRGVVAAMILVVLTYLLPTLALRRPFPNAADWSEGAWLRFALTLGGDPLFWVIAVAGLASPAAMFLTQMLGASRLPATLAEAGTFPRGFVLREGEAAPRRSILLCACLYAALSILPFGELVQANAILYTAGIVLEFAALIALRVRAPEMPRPFRIPGGVPTLVGLGAGPIILAAILVVTSVKEEGMRAQVPTAIAIASGPIVYALFFRRRLPRGGTTIPPAA